MTDERLLLHAFNVFYFINFAKIIIIVCAQIIFAEQIPKTWMPNWKNYIKTDASHCVR